MKKKTIGIRYSYVVTEIHSFYSRICWGTRVHIRLSIQLMPLEFLEQFTAASSTSVTILKLYRAVDRRIRIISFELVVLANLNKGTHFINMQLDEEFVGNMSHVASGVDVIWVFSSFPSSFGCSWLWVRMITLSVSESRLELFAVDVVVLGVSSPPLLCGVDSACQFYSVDIQ